MHDDQVAGLPVVALVVVDLVALCPRGCRRRPRSGGRGRGSTCRPGSRRSAPGCSASGTGRRPGRCATTCANLPSRPSGRPSRRRRRPRRCARAALRAAPRRNSFSPYCSELIPRRNTRPFLRHLGLLPHIEARGYHKCLTIRPCDPPAECDYDGRTGVTDAMFAPVAVARASSAIAEQIRNAILTGRLRPANGSRRSASSRSSSASAASPCATRCARSRRWG